MEIRPGYPSHGLSFVNYSLDSCQPALVSIDPSGIFKAYAIENAAYPWGFFNGTSTFKGNRLIDYEMYLHSLARIINEVKTSRLVHINNGYRDSGGKNLIDGMVIGESLMLDDCNREWVMIPTNDYLPAAVVSDTALVFLEKKQPDTHELVKRAFNGDNCLEVFYFIGQNGSYRFARELLLKRSEYEGIITVSSAIALAPEAVVTVTDKHRLANVAEKFDLTGDNDKRPIADKIADLIDFYRVESVARLGHEFWDDDAIRQQQFGDLRAYVRPGINITLQGGLLVYEVSFPKKRTMGGLTLLRKIKGKNPNVGETIKNEMDQQNYRFVVKEPEQKDIEEINKLL